MNESLCRLVPLTRKQCFSSGIYIDDVVFYVGYTLWLATVITSWYSFIGSHIPYEIVDDIRIGCIVVVVLSEALSIVRGIRWTSRSFVALACIILLGIGCYNANVTSMLLSLPFLFCVRNRNIDHIFTITAVIMASVLWITILAASFGLLPNITAVSEQTRVRQFLGFRYPLYPATLLFIACCSFIAARKHKTDWHTLLIMLIAVALVFYTSMSRLSFSLALLALFAAGILLVCHPKPCPKALALSLSVAYALSAAISIIATVIYNPEVAQFQQLNVDFGQRLALGHNGIETFGLTFFGQEIHMVSGTYNPDGTPPSGTYNFIDSIYIQCLVRYGILYLLVYVCLMTAATYKAFRSGNYFVGVFLILFAIQGIIDNQSLYTWMNPFLFYAMTLFKEPCTSPSS